MEKTSLQLLKEAAEILQRAACLPGEGPHEKGLRYAAQEWLRSAPAIVLPPPQANLAQATLPLERA